MTEKLPTGGLEKEMFRLYTHSIIHPNLVIVCSSQDH